mmetsp:Transcript_8469/g.31283  ORF Transcript_8469/g.31283 Transcript_8469/m.31283 type:complete len:198 (-) Transcript_8469:8006-8599(-)
MALATEFMETKGVVQDLHAVFESREDFEKISQVREELEAFLEACATKEQGAQDFIREFSQRVALVEKDANNTDSDVVHAARMRKFETEKLRVGKTISQFENEESLLKQQQEELAARGALLQKRRTDLETLEKDTVPRVKHELSLYAHVSKIIWHYEPTSRIVGHITDPANGDVKEIDIDPTKESSFQVANQLWDLVD